MEGFLNQHIAVKSTETEAGDLEAAVSALPLTGYSEPEQSNLCTLGKGGGGGDCVCVHSQLQVSVSESQRKLPFHKVYKATFPQLFFLETITTFQDHN